MKVALVIPESHDLTPTMPPVNMGYLASYLRAKVSSVEVKIIDGMIHFGVTEALFNFQPDVIGVTATTPQAPAAYSLLDSIKRSRPNILTIIGGVHASALPQEAAEHADVVVIGEGELALVDIVKKHIAGEAIPKIVQGTPIDDLDSLPMPAYDLLNIPEYLRVGGRINWFFAQPVLWLLSSRGCPYRCAFCYNSCRKTKPRWFSAQRIVEEIMHLMKYYGIKRFYFNDDEFLVNSKRLKELNKLFAETGLNKEIVWGCQARVENVTPQNIALIKEMGCIMVSSGFEHGNNRILSYLKSGSSTVEKNTKAAEIADKCGLLYGGSVIFGTPTENLEEMKQTVNWFLDNEGIKYVVINFLVPYPETNLWSLCKKHSLLPKNLDYSRLVPLNNAKQSYHINPTVPAKVYVRFMEDANRLAWLTTQIRPKPSLRRFCKLIWTTSWWLILFMHPKRMFEALRYTVRYR